MHHRRAADPAPTAARDLAAGTVVKLAGRAGAVGAAAAIGGTAWAAARVAAPDSASVGGTLGAPISRHASNTGSGLAGSEFLTNYCELYIYIYIL